MTKYFIAFPRRENIFYVYTLLIVKNMDNYTKLKVKSE